jgi:hypothetical protein
MPKKFPAGLRSPYINVAQTVAAVEIVSSLLGLMVHCGARAR